MNTIAQRMFDSAEVIAHKIAFSAVWVSNPAFRKNIPFTRVMKHDAKKALDILTLGDDIATKIHRKESAHHNFYTVADLWEGICDWECARITKPKKPLNARQTWEKYYNHLPCDNLLKQANL